MRIALSFPGCHRRGGVERVMFECANFLAARGHDTHVYAADFDEPGMHPDSVKHRIKANPSLGPVNLLTFPRRVQRQLQHATPQSDVLGVFGVQSPHGGVVWVQSVHKAWMEISRERRGLLGRLKQRINPFHPLALALEAKYFAGRNYRKLIALTEQVKADLIRLYSVPAQDIVVLPNGFSPAEFDHARAQSLRPHIRAELAIKPDEQAVIFVANELERKGFGPLIRAIASLPSRSTKLIVAGRASLKPYAAEIARLGLGDRVVPVGSTSDVARYYAAADVFALPTQYEAWGLVIVEALACGVPVITSRLAGAAVAVTPGRTGELLEDPDDVAEIADKLGRLLAGGYEPPDVIARSVADYAWPNILQRYEQILTECASPPGA